MTTETRRELWRIEHGEEYRPAPFFLALLESGTVEDHSWHNDTCPHFATVEKRDGRALEVFMEAERPEDREDPDVARYSFYWGDDNGIDETPVYCTNDDSEAELVFEKFFAGEPIPEGGIRWWETPAPERAAPEEPAPAEKQSVGVIASGYEWVCPPPCGHYNRMFAYSSPVTCERCDGSFEADPPEHAYGR